MNGLHVNLFIIVKDTERDNERLSCSLKVFIVLASVCVCVCVLRAHTFMCVGGVCLIWVRVCVFKLHIIRHWGRFMMLPNIAYY